MTEDTSGAVATPAATREALLRRQARHYTQVRGVLVQLPAVDDSGSRASLLAAFVSARKHRALLLYLLLLGAWPEIEKRIAAGEDPLEAAVWIRALTSDHRRALTWSPATLSRAWSDLEELGLIVRRRQGRLVRVVPRREDGRADYTRPGGRRDHENAYFALPDSFWHQEWFAQLTLPALAMLLLLLKETNGTPEKFFTLEQFQDWYGVRRRTAQNGISDLTAADLVNLRREVLPNALSGSGTTVHTWYSLKGDFGHDARAALRSRAQSERLSRDLPATQDQQRAKKMSGKKSAENSVKKKSVENSGKKKRLVRSQNTKRSRP